MLWVDSLLKVQNNLLLPLLNPHIDLKQLFSKDGEDLLSASVHYVRKWDHYARLIKRLKSYRGGKDPDRLRAWATSTIQLTFLWLQHTLRSYTFSILKFQTSFLNRRRHISHHPLFIAEHNTLCNIMYIWFRAVSFCGGVAFCVHNQIIAVTEHTYSSVLPLLDRRREFSLCLSLETGRCFYCTERTRGRNFLHKTPWGSQAK